MAMTFVLVFLALFGVIATILILAKLLDMLNDFYENTQGRWLAKVLLFVPWVCLAIVCFVIDLILSAIIVGGAVGAANSTRDWWHKK